MTTIDVTRRPAIGRPWSIATRLLSRQRQAQQPATPHPVRNFIVHFLEMLFAMMAGMMVLGGAVRMSSAALGVSGTTNDTGPWSVIMAINMTIGMAAWMRYRGHNLRDIAEMSGAMLLPLAVLIGPFLAGVISRGALLGGMHMLMLPAMLAVMLYRRDVYSRAHADHASAGAHSAHTSH